MVARQWFNSYQKFMKSVLCFLFAIPLITSIVAGCTHNYPIDLDDGTPDPPQLFESISDIKPIMEKKPESEMLFIQAMNAYDAGKLNEANAHVGRRIGGHPDFTLAWFNKSFILIEQEPLQRSQRML